MESINEVSQSLYMANDVARILKISRSMAYRLIEQGIIPSVRINTSVRVRPVDLETFINRNCTGCIDFSGEVK